MSPTQIVIYGAGGFAREVVWLVRDCNSGEKDVYEVVCFVDDDQELQGSLLNDIPVVSLDEARSRFPDARIVGGVGSPHTRRDLMEKAASAGFSFGTIIHPRTEYSEWIEVGTGTVICAGSILTTNIVLGRHVQVNLDCTLGHDVVLGDYATLAPGVHVSGYVRVGARVYIGTGAVIINGIEDKPVTIGDDAVVGAGACVTESVSAGDIVVGVPARPLRKS